MISIYCIVDIQRERERARERDGEGEGEKRRNINHHYQSSIDFIYRIYNKVEEAMKINRVHVKINCQRPPLLPRAKTTALRLLCWVLRRRYKSPRYDTQNITYILLRQLLSNDSRLVVGFYRKSSSSSFFSLLVFIKLGYDKREREREREREMVIYDEIDHYTFQLGSPSI